MHFHHLAGWHLDIYVYASDLDSQARGIMSTEVGTHAHDTSVNCIFTFPHTTYFVLCTYWMNFNRLANT